MTLLIEGNASVAKTALEEAREAIARGKTKGIPLVDIAARVFQRDGIQIPLSRNKFDVSPSVQEQLRTSIRNAVGRPDEITYISAMCVPHRKTGGSISFRAGELRMSDDEVRSKYREALAQMSPHINVTGGTGCQVFLKVDAPPAGNIGGHGL